MIMDALLNGVDAVSRYRTALTLAGTWTAWMFSILSVSKCNFMVVAGLNNEMGLFSRTLVDELGQALGCVKYSSSSDGDDFDSTFASARAFAVLCVLCLSLAATSMSTVMLVKTSQSSLLWNVTQFSLAVAAVAQMLTFVLLGSEKCSQAACSLTGVGSLAVFNTLLLVLLSIGFFFLPVPIVQRLAWWSASQDGDKKSVTSNIPMDESSVFCVEESVVDDQTAQSSRSVLDMRSFRISFVSLLGLSWSCSCVGVCRCTLMLVSSVGEGSTSYSGLGLYSQAVDDSISGEFLGCVAYPKLTVSEFDGPFRTGRAFGIISVLLMSWVLVMGILQLFLQSDATLSCWRSLRLLLPSAMCSQLIAFAAFGSERCDHGGLTECKPGGTGVFAILNVHLQLALTILVFLIPPPSNPVFKIRMSSDQDDTFRTLSVRTIRQESPDSATVVGQVTGRAGHHRDGLLYGENRSSRDSLIEDTSASQPSHWQEEEADDSVLEDTLVSQSHWQGDETDDSLMEDLSASQPNWQDEETDASSAEFASVSQAHSHASALDDASNVDSITVSVEYTAKAKKTSKILTHLDGTQTITSKVEELLDEEISYTSEDRTEDGLYGDSKA